MFMEAIDSPLQQYSHVASECMSKASSLDDLKAVVRFYGFEGQRTRIVCKMAALAEEFMEAFEVSPDETTTFIQRMSFLESKKYHQ